MFIAKALRSPLVFWPAVAGMAALFLMPTYTKAERPDGSSDQRSVYETARFGVPLSPWIEFRSLRTEFYEAGRLGPYAVRIKTDHDVVALSVSWFLPLACVTWYWLRRTRMAAG